MFNIGRCALVKIAFRTERYLVTARDFSKDVTMSTAVDISKLFFE